MNQPKNSSNAFVQVPTASAEFIEHLATDMGMLTENIRQWAVEYKEQGKRELLLRLIKTKYGTEAREQLTEILRRHTTTEALDQFGEWIIECESAEELFQRHQLNSSNLRLQT